MTHRHHRRKKTTIDKLVDAVLNQPWLEILTDLWKLGRDLLKHRFPKGPYEVLEYESTLELLDPEGKRAIFRKREKIRYLQDNIIAYQDQAWGDGEILVNYRCTPGKPVDCYRTGHKWHMLISRQEVKNRGDIDEFNIEWEIHDGFLQPTGYWETHVIHLTDQLEINVTFPSKRGPDCVSLVESRQHRRQAPAQPDVTAQPDGRYHIRWETQHAQINNNYILQWNW